MSTKRTSRLWIATLAGVAALGLTACRSDGGIGRQDNHSFDLTVKHLGEHTRRDVDRSRELITGLPEAVADDWNDGVEALKATYLLYLETTTGD